MSTKVIPLRGVRKPSLILVKGGRGTVATTPLTDDERYPRFPPAWVDWLVLGLGLAALNLPFPIPLCSVAGIALIVFLVARRVISAGGRDPNADTGVTLLVAEFFKDLGLKGTLEREFPAVAAIEKQLVTFFVCEAVLYFIWRLVPVEISTVTLNFLTILLFALVALIGLRILMSWDTPMRGHKKS